MITKSEFFDLIEDFQEWQKDVEATSNILGIDNPYEGVWIGYATKLFDKALNINFNENAIDDINWWLYERDPEDPECQMSINGIEIPTKTLDDLWNIVRNNRK